MVHLQGRLFHCWSHVYLFLIYLYKTFFIKTCNVSWHFIWIPFSVMFSLYIDFTCASWRLKSRKCTVCSTACSSQHLWNIKTFKAPHYRPFVVYKCSSLAGAVYPTYFMPYLPMNYSLLSLQWRHNERDGVSNHRRLDCLLKRFFQAQIEESIKAPRPRPLWGESTVDRWFPSQRASNAENVSIWWRHHDHSWLLLPLLLAWTSCWTSSRVDITLTWLHCNGYQTILNRFF